MNKKTFSSISGYLGYLATVIVLLIVIAVIFNMFFNKSNDLRDRLSEKTSKALVLSCMDFRFINDKVSFLNKEYNINAKIYKKKYKYIHTNIKNILYDIVLLYGFNFWFCV